MNRVSTFLRRLLGCFMIRLDTPDPGEFRVAVEVSEAQRELGTGYFFVDKLQRGGIPLLADDNQRKLYIEFIKKIDANNKRRNIKYVPYGLCLLIPFFVMLIVGDATEGFNDNPFFLIGFIVSVILPFVILPWIPSIQNSEREWAAILDSIHENAMTEWNDQGICVSRVDDKRCPKMIYFSFQKIQVQSEGDNPVDKDDESTEGEFVAEMVRDWAAEGGNDGAHRETTKQRGVRMIASAHGDLRKLLKNKDLRGLVGGVEVVTMGDIMAKEEADSLP